MFPCPKAGIESVLDFIFRYIPLSGFNTIVIPVVIVSLAGQKGVEPTKKPPDHSNPGA